MVEVDSVRAMRRKSMDMRLAVGAQTAFSSLLLATGVGILGGRKP